MPQETGKQRAQRIEMDYYRQRGGLARSKVILGGLALLLGGAVVAYAAFTGGGDLANPGPVIAGHAHFEDDCSQCHQFMTPIAADSLREFAMLGISESKSATHLSTSCGACHSGTGDHYRAKMSESWALVDQNCSHCHADHQGRDFDLTAVADQKCAQCHDKLAEVCAGNQVVQLAGDNASISSFTTKHGDFVSLKESDPGTVKFDHAQHMLPGQPSAGGKDVIRLKDLSPEIRERYREKMLQLKKLEPEMSNLDTSDEGLVQLDCSSCHVMAGIPGEALNSDVALGRHMQPISFEDHCAACHGMNLSGRTENRLPVPHAAPWTEIDQWLKANITSAMGSDADNNPTAIGVATAQPAAAETLSKELFASKMNVQREALKQQCIKCHDQDLVEDDDSIIAARTSTTPLIPSRFLKHGVYDHAAHLTVDCKYCHAAAYEGQANDPPTDQDKVMIAGIESCVGCHRPEGTATPPELLEGQRPKQIFGGHSLWASDRCTMCHRYHTTPGASLASAGMGGEE